MHYPHTNIIATRKANSLADKSFHYKFFQFHYGIVSRVTIKYFVASDPDIHSLLLFLFVL